MGSAFKAKMKQQGTTSQIANAGNKYSDKYTNPEFSETIPDNLEEIEKQIIKLINKDWEVAWLIGKRLIHIKENYLDKTGFDNITAYAETKFGLKQRTAYNMMFIATNFTLLQASAIGYKLVLLQPLTQEKRQEYLTWINDNNPSSREIEQRIKSELEKSQKTKTPKNITVRGDSMTINLNALGFNSINYGKIKKEKKDELIEKLTELFKAYFTD